MYNPQRKSLSEKLDESLGKHVDGIEVIEQAGQYKISFAYNPSLQHRLQRIDGVFFNKEDKTWKVSTDKKEFIARAVNDMREEIVADRIDIQHIENIANDKINGIKVKHAFTRDGQTYIGQILARNERYILQHTSKEYATVHRAINLSHNIEIGQHVKVIYQKGRGQIIDHLIGSSPDKAQELEQQ